MPRLSTSRIQALIRKGISRFSLLQMIQNSRKLLIIRIIKKKLKLPHNVPYFNTCCILAPNRAPGFEVGTRLSVTSAGTKRRLTLRIKPLVNFRACG